MHHLSTLAAAAANSSALDDMLRLIGIAAIVFAFFKGIRSLMTGADSPKEKPAPAPPRAASTAPAAATTTDGLSPEIIAVIAAAVASFTGKSHRIVSIKPMSTSWERAGRQSVLTSHRIR